MANPSADQISAIDASHILGVSKFTVYKMVKDGRLEAINIGEGEERPRYIFNRDEIEAYARRKMLDKSLESQALKRKISKEVVENEHMENVRLREENRQLKEAYKKLKRQFQMQMLASFEEADKVFKKGDM